MDWVSGKQSLAEPDAHYFDFWHFSLATAAVFTVASMGDAVLMYRAYTLWDRRLSIVIAPVALMLLSTGAGIYAIIMCGKGSILLITDFHAGGTILKDGEAGILAFACITLITNLSLTGLIVHRVRQLGQITNKYTPSSERINNNKLLVRLMLMSAVPCRNRCFMRRNRRIGKKHHFCDAHLSSDNGNISNLHDC
ncbi:hypothetical protein GYMLUDRAFT_41478 [Collybiopsis luxurians FD-317 M1]|uniref:Uncharacterized protein n=1 Tax=Collybiopsis luxurians FD-317 M1 TaxID=944289 RepID=A0A0D0CJY0_9AGAR|nr:hypothetical protein GYMLUDRAFT_41478 [Collybiopsis luxurians FD-317 M1]